MLNNEINTVCTVINIFSNTALIHTALMICVSIIFLSIIEKVPMV